MQNILYMIAIQEKAYTAETSNAIWAELKPETDRVV